MPGDDVIPEPAGSLTHAITVRCDRRQVWPWLAQMGAGSRAGWYSYDRLDNGGRPSARSIVPELQRIAVGTVFPALPGRRDGFTVLAFAAGEFLLLGWLSPEGVPLVTWSFVLADDGPKTTRLIVRARAARGYRFHGLPPRASVWAATVAHFIMQRKQLLGIARRAEAPSATRHVAIIQGHPDPEHRHFCHALADAYAIGAREAGHDVSFIDVARLDFPLARSRDDLEYRPPPEAIRQAQKALARADHIVLVFPIWNGAMPALLKGFLEQTFRSSFIFPDARSDQRPGFSSYWFRRKALAGKSARVVATMQMPGFVYRWFFHPHLEKNTLKVGGVNPVRESFVGLVEGDAERRARWLRRMQAYGQRAR